MTGSIKATRRRRGAVTLSATLALSVLGLAWAVSSPDRLFSLLVAVTYDEPEAAPPPTGHPLSVEIDMTRAVATVAPEQLSFAIDTSQVVGGHWWASEAEVEWPKGEHRTPPFDFARADLRRLTRALAPAYLRIGGTEADSTYYAEGDEPTPEGYEVRLERSQWEALTGFARDTGTRLVFTLNGGPGPRDAEGRWQPDQARRLMQRAKSEGSPVAVWELGNEVNAYWITHGPSNSVSPQQYADDLTRLGELSRAHTPGARLAGPGIVLWPRVGEPPPRSLTEFARQAGEQLDILTWHYYPQQSRRCPIATRRASGETLLQVPWLDEVKRWAAYVESARDHSAAGAEVWLGESGSAQCGGEPGVSDRFVSSLWWLDQLGALARRNQQVVVRQTLAGSHYGLIDDATLEPRPDYYASVLFKQLMGTRVLDVQVSSDNPNLRLYAHCTAAGPGIPDGAVSLLGIHLDPAVKASLAFSQALGAAERFEVRSDGGIEGARVRLNGQPLTAAQIDGTPLQGEPTALRERQQVPALSYTFWVLKEARASACLD